jgi:hypothetical protein
MIPLITIPGSQDPGSPPLHISTSCGAAALCVYQHAVGTAYAYAVLHVPCTGVTPDPMPHTFGPRCRSLGSLVWGNPRIHDPGISLRYHRIALVGVTPSRAVAVSRGTRNPHPPATPYWPLAILPYADVWSPPSGCIPLWDHRPLDISFSSIGSLLRSSIRMYPRSSPRVISRCPEEDML